MKPLQRAALQFTKPFRPKILLALSLMLLTSFGEGISLLLLIPLLHYTGITPHNGGSSHTNWLQNMVPHSHVTLTEVLLIYMLIVISFACLNYVKALSVSRLQQRLIQTCRRTLFKATCYAPWAFLSQQTIPHITQMLTTEIQRISGALQQSVQLLANSIVLLTYLAVAMYLSWQVTSVALAACGLLLLFTRTQTIYAKRNGKYAFKFFRDMHTTIEQTLSGLKQAKLWQSEAQYLDQLDEQTTTLNKNQVAFARSQAATQWLFTSGGVVIVSVLFYLSAITLHIALSHVLVLLITFARIIPKLSTVQKSYQMVLNNMSGANALYDFYKNCQHQNNTRSKQPIHFDSEIKINNITYRHPAQNHDTLVNLSLTIPKGTVTAITGRSGCGKSTLMDCLSGLLEAQSGQILIDGTPLSIETQKNWQSQIAYVSQDPFLLHASIRDNFLWISDTLTDKQIWQALELAHAADFVRKLPQQLDSVVGHRGLKLSGGERQRIVLAQAILRKPKLLILDEATSQLDMANEQLIQQSLQALPGDITIVVVAHRVTSLANADQIILVDQGKANILESANNLQTIYA
ncbi:MAG: ABC transporter ATP-binding protein [Coxiellaceae bacterium]|nr:ABC transporter ATP-binding protein [Coxiellaceae bacterium]